MNTTLLRSVSNSAGLSPLRSGTSRRDSSWYLTLTHYLQQNGIAVLLPDKRGTGQSEGNWLTASFEDLATDTLAATAYLK